MSLSRSVMEELSEFVLHKPSAVLGNKFFDCRTSIHVEVSHKSDKFDSKLFVISKFRLFFLIGKSPSGLKIERSYHILSVQAIHLLKDDELLLSVEEAQSKKRYVLRCGEVPAMTIALHILTALKHYFPDIVCQLRQQIELLPNSLYNDFAALPLTASARPCHSFRRTYAALCDYYEQPYREEVSWDVEKIYTINNLRSLRIDDFSHLLPRDLLPIVGVLQYSSYFRGLIADGVRVPPELIDIILSVVRKSHFLAELHLRNCALPRDFMSLFCHVVEQCTSVPLECLDFSKNMLDDKKGFAHLSNVLPKMAHLRAIKLAECGLTEKCVNLLSTALYNTLTSSKPSVYCLTHLNLSYSTIKEEVSSLVNLVSLCSSLRVLDLTDTGFPLEKIWPALKYGGLQMEKLLLGGCNAGKRANDSVHTMKEYFSMAVGLSHISLANTSLSNEQLKGILLGLSSNQQLKPFDLNLDGSCEKNAGTVLEACLRGLQCCSISLRDNNLEADLQGVVRAMHYVTSLRRVDLGGNNVCALRRSSKSSHAAVLNRILLDIVKLCADDSPIEELILSKCQLGSHLSVILNSLGVTTSLRHLDISNNEMTNFGARILSKALQLNVSLRSLSIDNNKIGADGFVDIAAAMQINYTLTSIPYPINDLFECRTRNEHSRAVSALAQIEFSLERNRSASSAELANCKKVLNGGIQSLLDGCSTPTVIEDAFTAAKQESISPRILEMVDDFVEKIRKEASINVQESISRLGDVSFDASGDNMARAENIAVDRLRELWINDLNLVISDWRWRELCERSEQYLRSVSVGNGSQSSSSLDGSPSVSSPRILSRSVDASHRPRSIFGEVISHDRSLDDLDASLDLDSPPKPSVLTHIQKSRPKKRMGKLNTQQLCANHDKNVIDNGSEAQSTNTDISNDSKRKPLSERSVFRPAMLPEASLFPSSILRATSERVGSPKGESSHPPTPQELSPPPVPSRNREPTVNPPSLPPKPEPRTIIPLPTSNDHENSTNNRLSVADMTRMFNR